MAIEAPVVPSWLVLSAALLAPSLGWAARVQVPIEVGVGPAAYWFFGPLADSRGAVPHFGLKLNADAVIDQELIAANRERIPSRYRKMADGVQEARIGYLFVPDALILSPKLQSLDGTGVFGATWRPLGLSLPLSGQRSGWRKGGARLELLAGLLLTYAFIYSDLPAVPATHFLRPGLDLGLRLEVPASSRFLFSLGWASQLYLPQELGSFGVGPLERSIFHVGQAYLKAHFRFPHQASW